MKRSVAIDGPTPQFVRWAIHHACPLRELDQSRLPESTFRQLRGIREYSVCQAEQRIFESICIHPLANSQSVENARGFGADEVLGPYGGAEAVIRCCRGCPANAIERSNPGLWAGCYGWLPAVSGLSFGKVLRGDSTPVADGKVPLETCQLDYVELLETAIRELDLPKQVERLFAVTSPHWYGIWSQPELGIEQIRLLAALFENMIVRGEQVREEADCLFDLRAFRDALVACEQSGLRMFVELVPAGEAEGTTWTISAHCPVCRKSLKDSEQVQLCPACGRVGRPHGERKSKILGLRPYVLLSQIMGEENAKHLLERFENRC